MEENFDLEKISVRPSVYLHARKMENRLREKDKEKGKDGWHDGKIYYYVVKVMNCYNKILEIFCVRDIDKLKEKDVHLALKKCYDGSNFFMMLADNLRDELLNRGVKLHK